MQLGTQLKDKNLINNNKNETNETLNKVSRLQLSKPNEINHDRDDNSKRSHSKDVVKMTHSVHSMMKK